VIAGDGAQIRASNSISGEVMTTDFDRRGKLHKVVLWSAALLVTLVAFYVLNHFVMSMQGLPLNWDLTPLQ
jgi:hypothetical protein